MRALADACEAVLERYEHGRRYERIGRTSPAWQSVMSFRDRVSDRAEVRARVAISVRASAGQGNWALIPWVALLHADGTDSTRRGVYVAYLFRADMTGVYLTLIQGVTEPLQRFGPLAGVVWLREHADALRARLAAFHGRFRLDAAIDLRCDHRSAQRYIHGTVAHKFYERGSVPADGILDADLDEMLRAYEALLR